jgi:pyruvate dehydrogenase E2 component (dihydrolipoamide acetyltransferase)
MATAIRMPDFGTAVDEVRLVKWLVEEGESVTRGRILAEIETDKAASELESVADGVLLKQSVPAGESVKAGTVIAYVGRAGETAPEETPAAAGVAASAATAPPAKAPAAAPRVSPLVSNLARKLGVDLSSVRGTGESGTITREDVIRASKSAAAPAGEQLPRAQAAVARAVVKSAQEIPHLRVSMSIDMTAALKLRAGGAPRVSYDAIFLRAMALAAQAVTVVTARLEGERVIRPEKIDIAVAVGFDNQLYLPVVRDAGGKNLQHIESELGALATRARNGDLRIEDTAGACMALSNLGMYPVDSFDAIIFPGQSTILSLGAVGRRPVVVEDRIEVRPVVTVSLAADHRLINGRTAAEFLARLKQIIESGELA